jgi:hypothetical protein
MPVTQVTNTVRSYFLSLGPTLQHFFFEPNLHQFENPNEQIGLSENIGLRSITIYSQIDVISTALQFLSQVRSTDIEKVRIGLSQYAFPVYPTDLGPPNLWSILLSTPRFSKLHELAGARALFPYNWEPTSDMQYMWYPLCSVLVIIYP